MAEWHDPEAIRFMLAEMATRIAASEILTYAAAAEMDKTGKVTLKASEAKLMTYRRMQ